MEIFNFSSLYLQSILVILVFSNQNLIFVFTQHYRGVIELDELTFDMTASRFSYTLAKFDHLYAYGPNQEVFNKLGLELVRSNKNQDLLVTNLEVKDFDDQQCLELAKRYGITKDQFPAIRLFVRSSNQTLKDFKQLKPIEYPMERNRTTQKIILDPVKLRLFIWRHINIRLTLPNCTEQLDSLAQHFVLALQSNENTEEWISKLEKMVEKNSSNLTKRKQLNRYLVLMKRGQERGMAFFDQEHKRLEKLLNEENQSRVTWTKRQQLQARYNVLQSFRFQQNGPPKLR